jgi:hypothetical protein
MAITDQIIGAESGGDSNARNPNSSAFAHVRDEFRAHAGVFKLFLTSRPSAISGHIVSIGISAINGVSLRRLFSHVSQKCLETIAPSVANLNSSCSIKRVGDVSFVLASVDHATPRVILSGGFPASADRNRSAMRCIGYFGRFDLKTTATDGVAGLQIRNGSKCFISAIALTKHAADSCSAVLSDLWGGILNSNKSTKSNAGIILAGSH